MFRLFAYWVMSGTMGASIALGLVRGRAFNPLHMLVPDDMPAWVGTAATWALFAFVAFCHLHFGNVWSMTLSDLADPHPRIAPLITAAADGALVAVGVRIDVRAFMRHVQLIDRGSILWALGVAIAVAGYFVVAWAQVEANDIIRTIVRIPAGLLPDAQKALAAWLTAVGWLVVVCFFALLAGWIAAASAISSLVTSVHRRTEMLAGAAPVIIAFIYVPVLWQTLGPEITNRAITALETSIILGASFDTNDPSVDDNGRPVPGVNSVSPTCSNLKSNDHIAFLTSDAPHPSTVLLATIDTAEQQCKISYRAV